MADTEISVRLNINPLNIQEKHHLWEKESVVLMADIVTPFELFIWTNENEHFEFYA